MGQVLSRGIHCTKFGNFTAKESRDIQLTWFVQRPPAWPWPLNMWPEHLLSFTKFSNFQAKGSKDIEQTLLVNIPIIVINHQGVINYSIKLMALQYKVIYMYCTCICYVCFYIIITQAGVRWIWNCTICRNLCLICWKKIHNIIFNTYISQNLHVSQIDSIN